MLDSALLMGKREAFLDQAGIEAGALGFQYGGQRVTHTGQSIPAGGR